MPFPGDRAIKQFPRGIVDQFDAAIIEEGEICILMADEIDNWEIRVGDGVTPGGIAFSTKAYVDTVAGNEGLQEGSDALASTGLDADQRSWPATSFGLFAKKNNAVLDGSPQRATAPSNGDSSLQLATTGWVTNNFKKLGYLGSDTNETDFPIGHIIAADLNGNTPSRNATPPSTLRYASGTSQEYTVGGAGTALGGTWRHRGRITNTGGNNYALYERVL